MNTDRLEQALTKAFRMGAASIHYPDIAERIRTDFAGFVLDEVAALAAIPAPEGGPAPGEDLLVGQAQHLISALMAHDLLAKQLPEDKYLTLWSTVGAQLRVVHREAVRAALAAQPQPTDFGEVWKVLVKHGVPALARREIQSLWQADQAPAEEPRNEDLLLDLLAVIHGDGGHRTAEHGIAKSAEYAAKLVADWRAEAASQAQPKGMPADFEDAIGEYFDIGVEEGRTGINLYHKANAVLARIREAHRAAVAAAQAPAPVAATFKRGDRVCKTSGSDWVGRVVGTYSTTLTPEGYAVESEAHPGSVQIYPAKALMLIEGAAQAPSVGAGFDAEGFRAWVLANLPDDTVIGSSAWWADHLTAWAGRFVKAQAPAPAPATTTGAEVWLTEHYDMHAKTAQLVTRFAKALAEHAYADAMNMGVGNG